MLRLTASRSVTVTAVVVALVVAAVAAGPVHAQAGGDAATPWAQSDVLVRAGDYAQSVRVLLAAEPTLRAAGDRAEVYWRLARDHLALAERAHRAGEITEPQLLERLAAAETYADRAIELDAANHDAYFWKSAIMGRQGQIRGLLASFAMLNPMRDLLATVIELQPDHAETYYLLALMHARVPAVISFGSIDQAVSFARRAVALNVAAAAAGQERAWLYDLELAQSLYNRNWSVAARAREQAAKRRRYDRAGNAIDRGRYFEGTLALAEQSDRQEARGILEAVIAAVAAVAEPSAAQQRAATTARERLADWQ